MGRSYTYNYIGIGQEINGQARVYMAMSLVEVAQEIRKAAKEGDIIRYWEGQTKTGEKALGGSWPVKTERLKLPKLVKCPICNGIGNFKNGNVKTICVVCNGSGITKNGNWNKWSKWQIDMMKSEWAEKEV